MFFSTKPLEIPNAEQALPGRETAIETAATHFVSGNPLKGPFAPGLQQVVFGLGCFWGAEKKFWPMQGVHVTAVGYLGGHTANATYEEVCSGRTGHNEVVLVVFDPEIISFDSLLSTFWESHDPTQGMRQGNDVGTQYRSGIYVFNDEQKTQALASSKRFQSRLTERGFGDITTEIVDAGPFYYAEGYHQQYLAKKPDGYCGLGGLGVSCPIGVALDDAK